MKKLLLAILFSFVAVPAFAACTPGFILTPGSGSNQTFSTKAAADTNCESLVDIDTGSQMHADLTGPATLGSATAGLSTNFQSALSTTVVAVDAAAGQLYELYCYNPNASVAYVQLFDVASASVTLGTTTPKLSYGIPATNASGFTVSLVGTQFSTAISAAATTTATGNTALGTALVCNFKYK